MTNDQNKFYYPFCRENGCNGLLNIKYDDNFSIEYECDSNSFHKRKNIYFKTFERFYLKGKENEICSKCLSKLDNVSYNCSNCYKLYCTLCFINDEHIKKDINNLKISSKKCSFHNYNLTQYCNKCKQNFCFYCLINNENNIIKNHYKEHNFIDLKTLIPSKKDIINIINKIKKKSKFYEEIILLINQWERILISKSNQLKQNLRDEISLLEKIFTNYNQFFLNYSYLSLFKNFDNFKSKNNDLLKKFYKSFKIEEQTKILFEIFNINKRKETNIASKSIKLQNYYPINNGIIEKINNNFYFEYDNKKIYLIKYEEKDDNLYYRDDLCPEFDKKINSVYISPKKNQIFACLLNEKKVKIFDYNLKTQILKINENEIIDESKSGLYFNKCIDIGNEYLVTADNIFINVWIENKNENFSNLRRFNIDNKTSDILQANKDYFITIQPNNKTLTIFDIKNLKQEKIITNIDSIDSNKSLLLFNDYIIINCIKGISLFYIKTQEITQNIENYNRINQNKEIFLDNSDNISVLNIETNNRLNIISLLKLKMNEGFFEPLVKYEEKDIDEKIIKIISLRKEYLILCEKNLYSLRDESN